MSKPFPLNSTVGGKKAVVIEDRLWNPWYPFLHREDGRLFFVRENPPAPKPELFVKC